MSSLQGGDDYLTVDLIVKALNLEKEKIFAIYQFGSRVYRSHTKNSDYDMFIIYGREYVDKVVENDEYLVGGHISDILTFQNTIKNHSAVSLAALWIPVKFVVFEGEEMFNFRKNFMIDLKKLERGYLREENICTLKSRRLYKSDKKKSLKNLVHGVRYLLFGIQAAKTGRIYDFTVGNKYYEYMLTLEFDTWDEYYKKFESIYEKLHEELKEFVFTEKSKFYEKYSKNSKEILEIIHFLKENELKELTKIFSIQIEFLENGLISFISDPVYSNMDQVINRECQSKVILNKVSISFFLNIFLFKEFQLIAKSFGFSPLNYDIETKKSFKKPKREFLLFFNEKKFQLHPDDKIFWKLFETSKFKEIVEIGKSYSFSIEKNEQLNLLGIVNLQDASNEQIPNEFESSLDKTSSFSNFSEFKKEMRIYDPSFNGYIVIDQEDNFYHFEYPIEIYSRKIDYQLGDCDHNIENILEIIKQHSNHDEILQFFKEKQIFEVVDFMIKVYRHLCLKINNEFEKIKHIENSKEFSLTASKTKYKHQLLGIFNSKCTCLEDFWEFLPMIKLKTYFKKEMKNLKDKL